VAPAEPAGDVPRAILRTADLTARRQATGGWTIVGTVVNGTRTPALVDSLAILARRSDGEPAAVSTLASSCRYLGPNQRCPFLVEVPAPEGPLTWVAFIDAAATSPLPDPPLSQLEPPRLVLDSSGQPLVLGSLRNEDERARWLDGQVSLRFGGELLTVAWIRPPVPLAPGETRAFALSDFSGWQAISESETPDIDEIDIDLRLDPWGSAASEAGPLALQAEVTRFEQVGDRLFLRGVLGNGWSTAVIHPSALVSIRRTDGRLVSAGWVTAGQELAGGGSLGFLLVLPLPERADVAAAEFDLIGAGLAP
jgi:hypothetical protein